jgi:HK97 family phage major capsid protein
MLNSEIAALQSEATSLSARASELLAKTNYTAEEAAEMTSVQSRLVANRAAITKSQDIDASRTQLQASVTAHNAWETQVPATNRPASAYDVKGTPAGYTAQPGMVAGGYKVNLANKAYQPEIEPKGATIEAYLADGYSIDTIEKACTPAYKREVLKYMRSGGRDVFGSGEILRKAFTEQGTIGNAGIGGALVPIQWSELIMNPPTAGMLQDAVRTIPTTAYETRFPRVKSTTTAGGSTLVPFQVASPVTVEWGTETPSSPTDQSANLAIENVTINVNEVWAYGTFSISLLEDNAYGLSTLIPDIFQKSLSWETDKKLVTGTGSSQPWGLQESGIQTAIQIAATTTAVVKYVDLINVFYGCPQQFRAAGSWLMSSATLASLAALVDGSQRPLFMPNYGFIGDTPGGGSTWLNGSLLGRPIIISENVPSNAAATNFIYFGDFKSAYYMLDRVSPTIKVNDQPAYKNGAYEFVLRARRGGRVVMPNAIRALKGI